MPGFILLTYWCLIVPFIVIGGSGVLKSFGNSMRTVRGYAWRVFGTYVLVFMILIAFAIVLGFVLILLPLFLRSFVNSVVLGTLIAPFLALVATLIYYRLTAAHTGQPYTPTGPAGATVWEPPYPTTTPSPADSPGRPPADSTAPGPTAPDPTAPDPMAPGSTRPYPKPGPTNRSDGALAGYPAGPGPRHATTSEHPLTWSGGDAPSRAASRAAAVRDETPTLARTAETWWCTVRSEMNSRREISRSGSPATAAPGPPARVR